VVGNFYFHKMFGFKLRKIGWKLVQNLNNLPVGERFWQGRTA